VERLLTLPESSSAPLSIRAKALVFHDPASLHLLHDVERIARSEATVLVIGETGTGKELIARHVHAVSGRNGPFVAVNCGAFSESLIDAELFGHEAGAFTGASQARAGWFEAANGGTLFLDEIGDLPMALQVKLLRVLQERQVVRLGSRRGIALDVRLVAATNIDLVRAVEAQHFRADLYYRLSVATLRLPPLRERRADILPLARHFIVVYSSRLHLTEVVLSEAAQTALTDYSWPGNIRELENVIHYALIVCREQVIDVADIKLVPLTAPTPTSAPAGSSPLLLGGMGMLGAELTGAVNVPRGDAGAHTADGLPALVQLLAAWQQLLHEGHEGLLDQVEGALVHTAFAHEGSNQVRTARTLGITRNVLRTLLKRHGLLDGRDAEGAESSALCGSHQPGPAPLEAASAAGAGAGLSAGVAAAGAASAWRSQGAPLA